ncbi:MAG: 30S ribosomal protein S9 [Pseudonocardia sp.]|nr:30S ribosomal protein S9 [Pseudonocardia sp.]
MTSSESLEGQPVTTPEPETEVVDEVAEAPVEAEVEVTYDADAAEGTESFDDDTAESDDLDTDVDVDIAAEVPSVFSDRPIQTVGRRKEAVVRVRLMPGTGNFTLNGKSLETYFPNKLHQQLIREPLVLLEKTERFDIFANLHGGGTSGQAGALRLAIARALIVVDIEDRPPLKKAGFLTRDPRVIERKKYGLKKARKAPQYSKR